MISYNVKICTLKNKHSVAVGGSAFVQKHNNEHDFHTAKTSIYIKEQQSEVKTMSSETLCKCSG